MISSGLTPNALSAACCSTACQQIPGLQTNDCFSRFYETVLVHLPHYNMYSTLHLCLASTITKGKFLINLAQTSWAVQYTAATAWLPIYNMQLKFAVLSLSSWAFVLFQLLSCHWLPYQHQPGNQKGPSSTSDGTRLNKFMAHSVHLSRKYTGAERQNLQSDVSSPCCSYAALPCASLCDSLILRAYFATLLSLPYKRDNEFILLNVLSGVAAMQRGQKLLQTAARLGCAPALSAPLASQAIEAVPAHCLLCLRTVASVSQVPATNKRQQDLLEQQHQRLLLPSSALHQQYRKLFGIGDASDTHKDYKERRLIG